MGYTGSSATGLAMVAWLDAGAKHETFPESQKDKDSWGTVVHLKDGQLNVYEYTSHPIRFEDKLYACGSGRDFALAAMHCGKSTAEAVEIACLFENGCGNGVDTLSIN